MSESNEPDWLAELAKGGEALQREAMRIVKAAEEFAASGQARPFTRRVVRAVGAGIRELAASEPVAHELTLATTVTGTASATGVSMITAVGSIALPPMRFAGEGTVQEPGLIERNIGRIFALVLLAIGTAGLLSVHGQAQASVGFYAGMIFGALSLAFAIWAGRK
jgi:hypothetical protein